jgi:hypothetical protein
LHREADLTGYLVAFALELFGMAIIFWIGVPIFRELIHFQQIATTSDEALFLLAVILIQYTYWTRLQYDPPFNIKRRPFLSHLIIFSSRLSFIFASSVFSLVVYRYSNIFEFNLFRTPVMAAVLFSVFCFSRHLEKLGQLLQTGYDCGRDNSRAGRKK